MGSLSLDGDQGPMGAYWPGLGAAGGWLAGGRACRKLVGQPAKEWGQGRLSKWGEGP